MYHVMIVDDELYARTRVKVDLHLEQDGFLVDQEASSGQEALKKMCAQRPDILMIDMRMPVMDGVELLKRVKRLYPDLPAVALSGYEDFVYVRSSLKLGAVDYLLKHDLNREVVLEALQKCAEQIRQSSQKEKDSRMFQTQLQIGRIAGQRQAVLQLLRGGACTEPSSWAESLPFLGRGGNLQLILMQLDDMRRLEQSNGKIELVMLGPTILSILQEVIGQYAQGVIVEIGSGEFVILASFEGFTSRQSLWSIGRQLVQSLRHNLEKYTNLTACFVLGRIVQRPSDLAECYHQVRQEMSLRYLTGRSSLIDVSEGRAAEAGSLLTLDAAKEKEIAGAVERRDRAACMAILQTVFDDFLHYESDRTSCQVACLELLNLVVRNIRSMPFCAQLQDFCTCMKSEVLTSDSIQDNRSQLVTTYEKLFDFLEEADRYSKYNANTIKALEYIHAHYREEISLDEAARRLNVNKSYLSRIFSHDCRRSFTEYVAYYRIEQAKSLLDQGLSIKEVSEAVGIGNQSYFFRVFKAYTGTTPHNYGKKV